MVRSLTPRRRADSLVRSPRTTERVATQQGITEAQLRGIELNAIQKGHVLLVQRGILTQQQSDQGMQNIRGWDQATLDDHVVGWFLNS